MVNVLHINLTTETTWLACNGYGSTQYADSVCRGELDTVRLPNLCVLYVINVKKLNSLKHRVRSQITRLKLQKSFCDLEHGVLLRI